MDKTNDIKGKLRVFLVDDSLIAITLLKRMLSTAPDLEVVGTAKNGKVALELIPSGRPDVILTDLHMPVMDGFELTKELMAIYPKPILVVSASVNEGNRNVFELLEAGAVDVFPKPRSGLEAEFMGQADDLINRIRILSGVRVFRKPKKEPEKPTIIPPPDFRLPEKHGLLQIVAIGASTGGPQAFQYILTRLPSSFNLPLVCIQHIGQYFIEGFTEWLRSICSIKIEIAREGLTPIPGTAYFPSGDAHLLIDENGKFMYSIDRPVNGHRPSISETFKSVAKHFGKGSMGVLLTGMGNDGAEGLKAMADEGGLTIAQDEATSIVFGMPKCAIELGAAGKVLPLEEIAPMIISAAKEGATTP